MENRRPPPRKTNALGGAPTPPWIWLLLIGVLGLVFWQFVPKNEVQVLYYPWFIEQVQSGNIKSLSIEGNELRGMLRREQQYRNPPNPTTTLVRRFITHAPSEDSIQSIVQTLIQNDKKMQDEGAQTVEPTRVDVQPPSSPGGIAWVVILFPTIALLGIIMGLLQLVWRRARVPVYGGTQGRFDSEEDKIARAEEAILEAAKLCRDTVVLSPEQRERLERAMSQLETVLKSWPQPEI
jgi:cell division protease FtsH